MPHASFDGLRVLSLESRRAREVEKLIRTYAGEPFVVPAMREIPLESNTACFAFGQQLLAGDFDLVLFLTGVGVRNVFTILETRHPRAELVEALTRCRVVARGVKPLAALRELTIPVAAVTAEPSTWREILNTLDATFGPALASFRVAVQEYGASNPELLAELVDRCAAVTKVPVYQWGLPLDLAPLREAVLSLIHGGIDVVLFMTAVQVIHLFQVAEEMSLAPDLRSAFDSIVVVSVGPTTTEELQHYGIRPDFEPSRPRMGFMINEAAQYARKALAAKRTPLPPVEPDIPVRTPIPRSSSRGITRIAPSTSTMAGFRDGFAPLDLLHEISSRFASADPLHLTLDRIVAFVSTVIPCDSCFLYTLEGDRLVLRASRNSHPAELDQLHVALGEGLTGWVAQHREPVAIDRRAADDPRFLAFRGLPEDTFEALLCVPILCATRVVGVINLQHREPYTHTDLQRRLLSTLGVLVGAEMERARLETENSALITRLATRKLVDRAKGILQRDLNLTEDEAYRRMQKESRQRRKTMHEVAEAILIADGVKHLTQPEP